MAKTLFSGARVTVVDENGPVAGALIYGYLAGGLVAVNTWNNQSGALDTLNPFPIVCNANGQAIVWTDPVAHRWIVTDPDGVVLSDDDNISSPADFVSFSGTSDPTGGDALIGVKRTDVSGAVATTQHAVNQSVPIDVVAHAGILADGTDQTTALLGLFTANPGKTFRIPYGVAFVRKTLLASLPTSIVNYDESVINDFSAAGETTKHVGIMSSDTAVNDTIWSIDSGHHATVALNNFGTAGSTSAGERKGSILWGAGQFANGATNKRGTRGAAIAQFTKVTGTNFWNFVIRSLAPWAAIANEYETWTQGEIIASAGVYRVNGTNHYVSVGAGTCGSTAPVHASGNASDGGVVWTWVDTTDRGAFGLDQFGRVLLGSGSYGDTISVKVDPTDPGGGDATIHMHATGISKVAQSRLTPTNGSGVEVLQPYHRADAAVGGLRVMKSDSSGDVFEFKDTGVVSGLSATQAAAPTIASSATIAPTKPVTFISGVAAIATITVPAHMAATGGSIKLWPTGVFTWTNAGNIQIAGTAVVGKVLEMTWDVTLAKWGPSYTA